MVTGKTGLLLIFMTTIDLNNCLKQIKYPKSLRSSASICELPSNTSTIVETFLSKTFLLLHKSEIILIPYDSIIYAYF